MDRISILKPLRYIFIRISTSLEKLAISLSTMS
jgi:hypothetical protein